MQGVILGRWFPVLFAALRVGLECCSLSVLVRLVLVVCRFGVLGFVCFYKRHCEVLYAIELQVVVFVWRAAP